MGRLDGRAALVTGAATGIGAAIARRLAEEGATVAVNARAADKAQPVVDAIVAAGGFAIAAVGDVSVEADADRMVAEAVAGLGRLDVCVNNAGIQSETAFLDLGFDEWRQQLAVDLDGPFLVGRAAARHMAQVQRGLIVNISSVHEHMTRPGFTAYCVAKAGVGMLTRSMARELGPIGIRVVSVAPGAIDTAKNEAGDDPEARKKVEEGIPARRIAQPEEIAGLVAYLATDEARYITGTTVVMDGALEQEVSTS